MRSVVPIRIGTPTQSRQNDRVLTEIGHPCIEKTEASLRSDRWPVYPGMGGRFHRNTQWEDIRESYGDDKLEYGRKLAARAEWENDPAIVADILLQVERYGAALTEKAVDEVAAMAPDNPAKHMGYVVTLLKDWSKK